MLKELLEQSLPFWKELTEPQQTLLLQETGIRTHKKGTVFYHSGGECKGVEIVRRGRARVFISSSDGREITLYRLLENDLCMMSVACMIKNINFGITLETETDCEVAVIPREIYRKLNEENICVKNFTLELIASKFTDVMWLLEQLAFATVKSRIARALTEQSVLQKTSVLDTTHEKLAADIGTAREVVTRQLRQFRTDGLVALSRGKIEILDAAGLAGLITAP